MRQRKKITALLMAVTLCFGSGFMSGGTVHAEDLLQNPANTEGEPTQTSEASMQTEEEVTQTDEESVQTEEEVTQTNEGAVQTEEGATQTDTEASGVSDGAVQSDEESIQTFSSLPGATLPTDKALYIYWNESGRKWRWNINNTGQTKGECVHLDDWDGYNCVMSLTSQKSNGVQYYAIRHAKTSFYIDSEHNDNKENRVLHQYDKTIHQDNQRFRFVPVEGKENVYYILSKLGDANDSGRPLYIGLENKEDPKHRKVVTTSTPTEWYISAEDLKNPYPDIDFKGGEQKFAKSDGIVTFNPEGAINDINIQNDHVVVDGSDLHLFYIGTSSKFKLEWDDRYQGYYIYRRAMDESSANQRPYAWDVEGKSKDEGKQIHVWEKSQHPSQIWRFIPQDGDNTYHIYNAHTGKYLALRADDDKEWDAEGIKVVQSDTPLNWEVNMLDDVSQNTESANWMSTLPDDVPLSAINMPATHDTGATAMRGGDVAPDEWSMTQCQQLFPDEQLNMGIRAFDVRCDSTDDDGDPDIVHGDSLFQCTNRDGSSMSLSNIMSDARNFLSHHSRECVIVVVKSDVWLNAGDDENVAKAVEPYITDNTYPLWRGQGIPTLGEARGKVILLRRYEMGDYKMAEGVEEWQFGFDLSDWDSFSYKSEKKALEIFKTDLDDGDGDGNTILRNKVYVQDYYEADDQNEKMEYVYGTIEDATKNHFTNTEYMESGKTITQRAYLFNYTTSKDSLGRARATNQLIMADDSKIIAGNSIGITMLNYADRKTAEKIWKTNTSIYMPAEIVEQTLTNPQYGISISGKMQRGAKLEYVPLEQEHAEYQTIKEALQSGTFLNGWRLKLENEDGTDAVWEGKLTIRIKPDTEEKFENLSLYHLNGANEVSKLEVSNDGENLITTTHELGCFGLVQNEVANQTVDSGNNEKTDQKISADNKNTTQKKATVKSAAKTGDGTELLTMLCLMLISGMAAGCVLKRKAR